MLARGLTEGVDRGDLASTGGVISEVRAVGRGVLNPSDLAVGGIMGGGTNGTRRGRRVYYGRNNYRCVPNGLGAFGRRSRFSAVC